MTVTEAEFLEKFLFNLHSVVPLITYFHAMLITGLLTQFKYFYNILNELILIFRAVVYKSQVYQNRQ